MNQRPTIHAEHNGNHHRSERYAEHCEARVHNLTDKQEIDLERSHVTEKDTDLQMVGLNYRRRVVMVGKKTVTEFLAEVAFDLFILALVWLLRTFFHLHFELPH